MYTLKSMTAKFKSDDMRTRLKQALAVKNKTMRAASMGAGQGESYLAGVITNGRDPQLSRLIAVCDYLEVSLSWVLYGYDLPQGSEEIFQLLSESPDRVENIAALLRDRPASDEQ
jgi:transcriptional regulator with XRE-family HTH domain